MNVSIPVMKTKPVMQFWEESSFELLKKLAFEILSIPATSAFCERAFSQSGISSAGRRHRIGDKLLHAETMVRVNRDLVEQAAANLFAYKQEEAVVHKVVEID